MCGHALNLVGLKFNARAKVGGEMETFSISTHAWGTFGKLLSKDIETKLKVIFFITVAYKFLKLQYIGTCHTHISLICYSTCLEVWCQNHVENARETLLKNNKVDAIWCIKKLVACTSHMTPCQGT